MTLSGFLKFFCLFLAIQCVGFTLKADLATPATQSCTTTVDCPKDSWTTCCSGKCMVVDNCCPGQDWCPPSCCPSDQKCDMTSMKCVPESACPTGQIMCKGKAGEDGKCCPQEQCSPSGQCCTPELESICGDKCCLHGQCTTDGMCCSQEKGEACGEVCCPSDKPFCLEGVCSPLCNKERPCGFSFVCTEGKCCPAGSYPKLCGGKCCSKDSVCVEGQCNPCPEGTKPCNCPPDKKNCTSSCISEWDTCKHGVRICPSGNVKCGKRCMNPLDRICVKGKIKECPPNHVVEKNKCKTCPPNNIIENFQCKACPSGTVSVNNKCHKCITNLECRYTTTWDNTTGFCFSAVWATFADGAVKNVTSGGPWSQRCCRHLVETVQQFTTLYFCPGVNPQNWSEDTDGCSDPSPFSNPPFIPQCSSSPTTACERKCLNACKHGPSFIQVALCYWACIPSCPHSKSDKSDVKSKKE